MTFRTVPAPTSSSFFFLLPWGTEASGRSSSTLFPAKCFFILNHLPQAFPSIINQVPMNMHKSLFLDFIKLYIYIFISCPLPLLIYMIYNIYIHVLCHCWEKSDGEREEEEQRAIWGVFSPHWCHKHIEARDCNFLSFVLHFRCVSKLTFKKI